MASNKNKKFMERLIKHKGAVIESENVHARVVTSPSPSLNFTFGNAHGLPRGYSLLLYGPPRGGKSVICDAMAGQFHRDNPDGWVVKYNTEFREKAQSTPATKRVWGIDPERYLAYETNTPDGIFDHIEKDLAANVQDGMDLGLVIIDSLNDIQGRRQMNAETVMQQQIGDNALTIQEGLKRILPIQRECKFALILTSQIRAEMDMAKQMRGQKVRPAASFGVQHHCEYYMYVRPDETKDGRTDLLGNEFKDQSVEDMRGNNEKTGHKVICKIMDASFGPKGREGQFTFNYTQGIINIHEEVFTLGVNRGIIEKPNNVMYAFGGKEWKGKEAMLNAIRDDHELAQKILQELKRRDLQGLFQAEDIEAASKLDD